MQETIKPAGTVGDLISQEKVGMGLAAMTVEGRAYSVAAQELDRMIKRKQYVLEEYQAKMREIQASHEELVRLHVRIDQIIYELSRS